MPPGSNALPATGNAPPVLTTSSLTDKIRLGTGNSNTVRGLTVGDSGGANGDSSDISGSNIGTLAVSEVTLNGTGRALNLTGGGTIAPGSSIAALTVTQSTGAVSISIQSQGRSRLWARPQSTIRQSGNPAFASTRVRATLRLAQPTRPPWQCRHPYQCGQRHDPVWRRDHQQQELERHLGDCDRQHHRYRLNYAGQRDSKQQQCCSLPPVLPSLAIAARSASMAGPFRIPSPRGSRCHLRQRQCDRGG